MRDSLPKPSLIIEPAKTADMISISSKGLCGEDYKPDLCFSQPQLKSKLTQIKAGKLFPFPTPGISSGHRPQVAVGPG
jgi:hypothetical protein